MAAGPSVFCWKNEHYLTVTWLKWTLILFVMSFYNLFVVECLSECKGLQPPKVCGHGECVNGTCICFPGWGGEFCQECNGRISLGEEGIITDGEGNYSKDMTCSWLIDTHSTRGNVSVRLIFHEFATECGWDHLYIHDGDSAFAPLIATYSGLLRCSGRKDCSSLELNLHLSGRYAYLHFYSDAAYTMSGFNISYSVNGCYLNCSQDGVCIDGVCQCVAGRSGQGCEIDLNNCENNCSNNGRCTRGICICDPGYKGSDCNSTDGDVVWTQIDSSNVPSGRASHAAVLDGYTWWIVGGHTLNDVNSQNGLFVYDFRANTWQVQPEGATTPWPLYAHSAVMYKASLYVFGGMRNGMVKDELWMFNSGNNSWQVVSRCPYPISGHTAHVVGNTMLIFFGYSPLLGYINRIQQYNFDTGDWLTLDTSGAVVQGGYGHSSFYDLVSGKIFVYGGYSSGAPGASGSSSYNLTDRLYSYDVGNKEWIVLLSSGYPRYLHSIVVMNEYLLAFGGNTHNDTSESRGAKCYSSDFMLYDIRCNSWYSMSAPNIKNAARFGSTMTYYNGSLFLFGGFNGIMLSDLFRIELGSCDFYKDNSSCLAAVPGVRCSWISDKCQNRMMSSSVSIVCDGNDRDTSVCPGFNTCDACLAASYGCSWCKDKCTKLNCSLEKTDGTTVNCTSSRTADAICSLYQNCQGCQDDLRCWWEGSSCRARVGLAGSTNKTRAELIASCSKKPCMDFNVCSNCTSNCMWCSNLGICVDTNAYVASFPYGQCMSWTTKSAQCNASQCSGLKSCQECQASPMCGWCNDATNTGLGECMEGGQSGPVKPAVVCPASQWYFTECPMCQCNGHATCPANSSTCENCAFPTAGLKCESCKDFYYGSPINGGNCTECQCNKQADSCSQDDGECYCRTRGVTGRNCEKCDDQHKYVGDPRNGGTCYYRLSTDYQYTFNLSKKEDNNYTQINFLSIPNAGDRDVDFTLNCSSSALINITYKSKGIPDEQLITSSRECDYFRTKFEHKDYSFGGDMNTTFFVYVYGFKTPFGLQISFSQFPKIDLVHFFVTFFSCFLSLLLIAAALWKIKHKYDSYRRRQHLMAEMQQMASRPFSRAGIEIDRKSELTTGNNVPEKKELRDHVDTALRRKKKISNKPSAIAIEPLAGHKAAVLTLLVHLPCGDSEYAPGGQSGLAVASALVTLGSNRKQSLEHIKGEKPKLRKHHYFMHPDTFA